MKDHLQCCCCRWIHFRLNFDTTHYLVNGIDNLQLEGHSAWWRLWCGLQLKRELQVTICLAGSGRSLRALHAQQARDLKERPGSLAVPAQTSAELNVHLLH